MWSLSSISSSGDLVGCRQRYFHIQKIEYSWYSIESIGLHWTVTGNKWHSEYFWLCDGNRLLGFPKLVPLKFYQFSDVTHCRWSWLLEYDQFGLPHFWHEKNAWIFSRLPIEWTEMPVRFINLVLCWQKIYILTYRLDNVLCVSLTSVLTIPGIQYTRAEDDGMCSFDAYMCNVRERTRAANEPTIT